MLESDKNCSTSVLILYIFMCFCLDMHGAIFHLHMLTKSKLLKLKVQPSFNGSNTFGTMNICLRQGQFELIIPTN